MGVIYRATGRQILLNNRVMPVLFGHYAWLKEWQTEERVKVDEAGSGIFVAPGVALTARHVSHGFEKLDERIEASKRRTSVFVDQYAVRPVITQYSGLLYQAPTARTPTPDQVRYWGVLSDWSSPDTDITVLHAEPISVAAKEAVCEGIKPLEWQLAPPARGCRVDIYGFPKPKITAGSGFHVHDIELRSETVKVVNVFDVLQAHGFTEFPGFEVDRELAHGFSGGPAFYNGNLVGIFSGPSYVAALWPLLIHEYVHRDDNPDIDFADAGTVTVQLARRPFAELFENGSIHAIDLEDVKGRVVRVECAEALEGSSIESRCNRKHVVLLRDSDHRSVRSG